MSIRNLFLPIPLLAFVAPAEAQTQLAGFRDLARTEVVDSSGEPIGVLSDVMVTGEGRVSGLLIGQGGVLGIGQTLKAVPADTLPARMDGKIRLDGQTREGLARLPDYAEAPPDEERAATSSPPISGANQTATQSATANIPVPPSAARNERDGTLPPTPENDAATGQAAADSTRAPGVSPVLGEEAAQGSASHGMAPQQGTGSGTTQVTPQANESASGDDGNAAGAMPHLNQQFAREEQPANQNMPEESSGRAVTDATSPDASADPDEALPSGEGAKTDRPSWRIGKIIGATVHGDRDGISVKDVRFSADAVEAVVLAQTGQPDRTVPFSALNLGGTADAPVVALATTPSLPSPKEAKP